VRLHGLTEIALIKLDVLNGIKDLLVCTGYNVNGKIVKEMPSSLSEYRAAQPIYEKLTGWESLRSDSNQDFKSLPKAILKYIDFIESEINCRITILSIGPQRHQTILR
jgi:adenylosuccinate synthase